MRKKTIVATNVDGTPEIVKDNFNGLLVDSKNSSEISKAIIKIYENINLKEKFEKNAYKTYIDNFTIEEFADKYLKYYMNLIRLYNI